MAKVRFSFEEKTVLSSGGLDGLVVQWRFLSAGRLLEADRAASDDEDETEFDLRPKHGPGPAAAAVDDGGQDSDVEGELVVRFGRGSSEVRVDRAGVMEVKSTRMVTGRERVRTPPPRSARPSGPGLTG